MKRLKHNGVKRTSKPKTKKKAKISVTDKKTPVCSSEIARQINVERTEQLKELQKHVRTYIRQHKTLLKKAADLVTVIEKMDDTASILEPLVATQNKSKKNKPNPKKKEDTTKIVAK